MNDLPIIIIFNVFSISHVILSPTTSSTKLPASGNLSNLKSQHIDTFFAALDLSYSAALKFDARPSLKFLIEKVANLEKPANLYRQAGASWMIKIMTLFELSFQEVERTGVDLEKVKVLLGKTDSRNEDRKYSDLIKYLKQLRVAFDKLCETYAEIVMDKDGRYTMIDRFSEKKVFLLVAQPDEYAEIKDESHRDERAFENSGFAIEDDEDQEDEVYNQNLDEENGLEELGFDIEKEKDERPFRLSDLAVEYSTDSGPESEPETDDSRPGSRLGSNNDRIVYPDRSGCTSSEGCLDSKYSFTPEPLKSSCSEDQLSINDSQYVKKYLSRTRSTIEKIKWNNNEENEELKELISIKHHLGRRKSDICLLSRRSNLKFVTADSCERNLGSPYRISFRSKSAMELRSCDFRRSMLNNNSLKREKLEENVESTIPDNVEALLEDYKRSKSGFRTNPFLEDEEEKMLAANQYIFSQVFEFEFQKKSVINKDSEAHRKAWAETLNATFDWVLALSVSDNLNFLNITLEVMNQSDHMNKLYIYEVCVISP